jgi:outer membrane protein
MKNILTSILISVVISLLCIGIGYMFLSSRSPKMAYVKAEILFDEFELTKELKTKYSNVESVKTTILDSLLLNLKLAAAKKSPSVQQLEKEYYIKKEAFDAENQALTDQYNQQVWARINQYVDDFSQKKGYDLVLGANGSGSLFYANDKLDITKEVVAFMNEKYVGSK